MRLLYHQTALTVKGCLSQEARWRLLGLRILAWLARPWLAPAAPTFPPRRILLIRPDHLGDVLFTTPALAQLRAALPQAHIAYLCGPWSQDLLAGNPNLDQVLTCDFPWFNRRPKRWPWQPYQALWQEARRLHREGFDTAMILIATTVENYLFYPNAQSFLGQ